jgi:hypothetical protein
MRLLFSVSGKQNDSLCTRYQGGGANPDVVPKPGFGAQKDASALAPKGQQVTSGPPPTSSSQSTSRGPATQCVKLESLTLPCQIGLAFIIVPGLSHLEEYMTSLGETKKALQSPVRLWSALMIAAAVIMILLLAIWLVGRGDRRDVMRWSKGGDLEETKAFASAVNHPQDRGEWQSGAHDSSMSSGTDSNPDYSLPRVSVYSAPPIHPAYARPTLRDLGDLAQVRAIDAIEQASGSQSRRPWDDLRKTLSGDDEPGEKDPFLFERVLVATVSKGVKWPPGDRMVWTRIFVEPINFKFAAYTIAATENETIKVSSLEATKVRKLSADIGLAIPGLDGSKIGLAPANESTVKTTSDVSTQYERLGVDIMPTFLRIIRESGAGGDVIGNTMVSLSMTTDPESILAKKSRAVSEAEINLVVTGAHLEEDGKAQSINVLPLVPLPHCALQAKISAIYEQRHVKSGREFYDEARQNVGFIHDVDEKRTIELMGADDVSPFVWGIQLVPKDEKPGKWDTDKLLNARFSGVGVAWRPLVFSDYGRAVKLAHWVRTNSKKLKLSGYEFNWAEGTGLAVVKRTKDDCRE